MTLLLLNYSMVFHRLGRLHTYAGSHCKILKHNRWCLDWLESWSLLNLDLSIASVYFNLSSGTDNMAESYAEDAFNHIHESCHVPAETIAHLHHSMAFLKANKDFCQDALGCLEAARACRNHTTLGPDAGLEQDYQQQAAHVALCEMVNFTCDRHRD